MDGDDKDDTKKSEKDKEKEKKDEKDKDKKDEKAKAGADGDVSWVPFCFLYSLHPHLSILLLNLSPASCCPLLLNCPPLPPTPPLSLSSLPRRARVPSPRKNK